MITFGNSEKVLIDPVTIAKELSQIHFTGFLILFVLFETI